MKECVRIQLCNLHHRLMLSLCTFKHFILTCVSIAGKVSDIRYIHHTFYVISNIAKCFFQQIFHNVASQIANMRKMVHCRTTGVHRHLAVLVRNKRLHLPCQCIIKGQFVFHLLSKPPNVCIISVQVLSSAVLSAVPVPVCGWSSRCWHT